MLGVWIPAKELEKKRDSTDPLWGIPTRGQGLGVLDAFDTPGQAPLLRILLGLFPKKPPYTPPSQATPPERQGALRPLPCVLPTCVPFDQHRNIKRPLYTGACVCHQVGEGVIKAEKLLCSGELGVGGASGTVVAPVRVLSVVCEWAECVGLWARHWLATRLQPGPSSSNSALSVLLFHS